MLQLETQDNRFAFYLLWVKGFTITVVLLFISVTSCSLNIDFTHTKKLSFLKEINLLEKGNLSRIAPNFSMSFHDPKQYEQEAVTLFPRGTEVANRGKLSKHTY